MQFDFDRVPAIYRTRDDEGFEDNMYLDALPLVPSDESAIKWLAYFPEYTPEVRTFSKARRIQLLNDVYELVVPLAPSVALMRSALGLVRAGLKRRKPFTKADFDISNDLYAQAQKGVYQSPPRKRGCLQFSLGLTGASGCGKSFILRRIAELLPKAIHHEQYGKWQLPFLFIEMSPDGESVHTIADQLFEQLDQHLPGENYSHVYRKGNAAQRLICAFSVCHRHGVGAIVIDEKQNQRSIGRDPDKNPRNYKDKRPRDETALSKHLVMASNISHIPLVMAGTLETLHMLGARMSGARRVSGRGSGTWLPLEPSFDADNPNDFERLMKALWRYQYTPNTCRIGKGWLSQFYRLSQGIPDFMVKLFVDSQQLAVTADCPTMRPDIVEAAYKQTLHHAEFALGGLRTRDPLRLPVLTDVYSPGVSPLKGPVLPAETDAVPATTTATATAPSPAPGQDQVRAPVVMAPVVASNPPRKPGKTLRMGSAQPEPHTLPACVLEGVDLRLAIEAGQNPVGAMGAKP
jgi:energy-coupling factor transporter ATP-binding protein EcfA2